MRRRYFLALPSLTLVGCAAREFRPLEFPSPVQLQDPLPGKAIVYLLRAPHDPVSLSISVAGKLIAVLPPSTYTVASLPPGEHPLEATGRGEVGNAALLSVVAGERRFFYTSIPSTTGNAFSLVPFGAGVLPLFSRTKTPSGPRTWHECSEADAQGLISISRLVLPVQNAVA